MLAAAAAAGDDPDRLASLEPYLTRYLDGDARAWADYQRDAELRPDATVVPRTACCATPDPVFDVADDRVCRSCGRCQVVGPTSVAARRQAVFQLSRTNVTYERRNHWNEFMNCVLARESTVLPDAVQTAVRTGRPESVPDVHRLLRLHGHQKYYKNVYRLFRDATNRVAVVLDGEDEEILRRYFTHAEQAWIRSAPPAHEKRHNFLRNTFLLGMFARVLVRQRPWDAARWTAVARLMLPVVPAPTTAAMRIWTRIADHAEWEWHRDI